MMATTHVLIGMAIGTLVAAVAPEYAVTAVLAGGLGGLLPDLDLYAGHRRTLHFPVVLPLLAAPAVLAAVLLQSMASIATAVLLVAAAVHCAMDAFGGGLELKPWEATSDRGVYNHATGRWIAPRRWVRYDGAPEDLAVAAVAAVPVFAGNAGAIRGLVVVALVVSGIYVLLRKPLVWIAERGVPLVPSGIRAYVPARFIEEFEP